jgi:hypothetical protein
MGVFGQELFNPVEVTGVHPAQQRNGYLGVPGDRGSAGLIGHDRNDRRAESEREPAMEPGQQAIEKAR